MHLVEVDALDAEAQRGQPAVLLDSTGGRPHREDLRRHERFVAPAFESPSDDRFGDIPGVDLRGVDQVHAEVEGPMDELHRGGLAVRLAVAPVPGAELPASEPDRRDPQTRRLDVLHGASWGAGREPTTRV